MNTCPKWQYTFGLNAVNAWGAVYLPRIAKRINTILKPVQLTSDHVRCTLYRWTRTNLTRYLFFRSTERYTRARMSSQRLEIRPGVVCLIKMKSRLSSTSTYSYSLCSRHITNLSRSLLFSDWTFWCVMHSDTVYLVRWVRYLVRAMRTSSWTGAYPFSWNENN